MGLAGHTTGAVRALVVLHRVLIPCMVAVLCAVHQAEPSSFGVRSDGTVLRDGTPFYPIGIYREGSAATEADLRTIAAAGFNFVHLDPIPSNGYATVLDDAWRAGLYVMTYVADWSPPAQLVNQLKSHPAILGWDIADDAHRKYSASQVSQWNTSVKAADPDHFTYLTVYDPSAWGPFMDIADMVGPYKYPVYTASTYLFLLDERMQLARTETVKLAGIPQAYAWPDNRMPTPHEYRNMVYQNLANNVKMMLPYTFASCHPIDSLWNEVASVNAEISRLAQAAMTWPYARVQANASHVALAMWQGRDSLVLVVVNTDGAVEKQVSFSIPAGATGSLIPLFPQRPSGLSRTGSTVSGRLAGGAVHVYAVSMSTTVGSQQRRTGRAVTRHTSAAAMSYSLSGRQVGTPPGRRQSGLQLRTSLPPAP